jgi:hypothetical protein
MLENNLFKLQLVESNRYINTFLFLHLLAQRVLDLFN